MQTLAAVFVSLVSFLHAFYPDANIPKVLGVETTVVDELTSEQDQQVKDFPTPSPTLRSRQASDRFKNIGDQQKVKTLNNIQNRMTSIHLKWSENWVNILDRLEIILGKIESRRQKLEDQGIDTEAVRVAIEEAEIKIDDSYLILDDLQDKDYILEVAQEDNLGATVRAYLKLFKDDLVDAMGSVMEARRAVHAAFQVLKDTWTESVQDTDEDQIQERQVINEQ